MPTSNSLITIPSSRILVCGADQMSPKWMARCDRQRDCGDHIGEVLDLTSQIESSSVLHLCTYIQTSSASFRYVKSIATVIHPTLDS